MDAPRSIALAAACGLLLVAPAAAQTTQIAPDVTQLKVTPKTFKALPKGPTVVAAGGALVTFKLDTGANVDFRVSALKPGVRTAAGCVAGKAKAKAKRCTRNVAIPGAFTVVSIPGSNDVRFSGVLKGSG